MTTATSSPSTSTYFAFKVGGDGHCQEGIGETCVGIGSAALANFPIVPIRDGTLMESIAGRYGGG
jgi:hypothetical protein